jgi:5-methylcytosine-specific restriction endonuclease McrA
MKRENFNSEEEYLEFRKKANERNKRYYSKPEIKEIRKIYKREYERRNRDKINTRQRERRVIKKEKGLLWSQRFPDRVKAYTQTSEFKIKKREADKRWRDKNAEKLKIQRMNPEYRSWKKSLYEKNKEHLKELRRKYYKTERGILSYKRRNHIKMAIRKERPTDLTRERIREIFDRDKVCVYCGSNIQLELDHIVPLDSGGSCMSNNLVIACAKCNRSKSGRDVFYWCKLQGIGVPKIVLELLSQQKLNTTSS